MEVAPDPKEKKNTFKKSNTNKRATVTKKASLKRQNKRRSVNALSSSQTTPQKLNDSFKQVQFPQTDPNKVDVIKISKKSNLDEKRNRSLSQAEKPPNRPAKQLEGSPVLGSSGVVATRANLSYVKRKKSGTLVTKGISQKTPPNELN